MVVESVVMVFLSVVRENPAAKAGIKDGTVVFVVCMRVRVSTGPHDRFACGASAGEVAFDPGEVGAPPPRWGIGLQGGHDGHHAFTLSGAADEEGVFADALSQGDGGGVNFAEGGYCCLLVGSVHHRLAFS